MEHVLYFVKRLYIYAGRILYINLLAMVAISLFDGIGIFLVIPLISTSGIANLSSGSSSILQMFDFLNHLPEVLVLPVILGSYILIVIGQNLLQRNITIRNVKIIQGFGNHLRLETYSLLQKANWSFYIKKRKSDFINLFTTELPRVTGGTNLFMQLIAAFIFTLIQVGIAFWLSAEMTVFVLVSGLFLAFFSRKFIRRSRLLGNKTSELAQSFLAGITDHFNGVKDIKSNTLEQSRMNWFRSLTQRMVHEQVEHIKLRSASQLSYKTASAILIAGFIYLFVTMFHAQTEKLLLIILIFSRLWPRFTSIQSNMEQIAAAIPAFNSLIQLQKECRDAMELKIEQSFNDNWVPVRLEQGLKCNGIYFRYNRNESSYALHDINLHIRSNRMTAIVGPSGAGKSTLIDVLMGLLEPESGQVLVDDTPLTSHNLIALRQSISYVPQDPFLFNGSIRDNLLMIKPNATEEKIWEALEFSASSEFVRRLPQGLDTHIGDRGIRLSGGERQRLVLARAILREPSILILDEATSALDTENELKIQEALECLRGTMTIIVIAHRLSTIRNADQVIVLNQGSIVQTGEYNQLSKEKAGMFNRLLTNQQKVVSIEH